MIRVHAYIKYALLIALAAFLTGCATVKNGANVDYTIRSSHSDVTIMLDLETQESRKAHDWRDRRASVVEGADVPDFDYHRCEATPCTINIPKARAFSVMAYKDGYVPQIYDIAQIRIDEFEKLTAAAATGATAASIGAFGAAVSTLGNLSGAASAASTTAIAGPVLIVAFPAALFMFGSNEIDKDNMANYTFYPNPLAITLTPVSDEAPGSAPTQSREAVIAAFSQRRIDASLDPVKSDMCYIGEKRMGCWRAQKVLERRAKARARNQRPDE